LSTSPSSMPNEAPSAIVGAAGKAVRRSSMVGSVGAESTPAIAESAAFLTRRVNPFQSYFQATPSSGVRLWERGASEPNYCPPLSLCPLTRGPSMECQDPQVSARRAHTKVEQKYFLAFPAIVSQSFVPFHTMCTVLGILRSDFLFRDVHPRVVKLSAT
jgi:hypothetical protein